MRAATVETSMVGSARIVNLDGKQAFSQVHLKHNYQLVRLGKPSRKKSAVFLTLFKRPLTPFPPPFYLNICPILQGVFFKTRF